MDIFFQDPSEIPLPPAEVRIRELKAQPWVDGQRVGVYLEIDPFQKRPNAEISILNDQREEVASVSIIETIDRKMELTMHLRGVKAPGNYTIQATLFYAEQNDDEDNSPESKPDLQTRSIVDRAQTSFNIAN
jgi:hypothetical protein